MARKYFTLNPLKDWARRSRRVWNDKWRFFRLCGQQDSRLDGRNNRRDANRGNWRRWADRCVSDYKSDIDRNNLAFFRATLSLEFLPDAPPDRDNQQNSAYQLVKALRGQKALGHKKCAKGYQDGPQDA